VGKQPKSDPARSGHTGAPQPQLSDLLRVPPGVLDLGSFDTRGTPGYPGSGKSDAPTVTEALAPQLADLQERLYAEAKGTLPPEATDAPGTGHAQGVRSVLVILQGMDTAGKGGVIRHAIGMVDPQGVRIASFKSPTKTELSHSFLWRIRRELPAPGQIGIFDRSHYEDVLVVRVNSLVPTDTWSGRYETINEFETRLVAGGTSVIKCFLHISADEQKDRLAERLDRPDKIWKYNPGDVVERAKWPAYVEAYTEALTRCNTDAAPWHIVPSGRKWYRNWAVAQLLWEHLERLDPQWPKANVDVAVEKQRLAAT